MAAREGILGRGILFHEVVAGKLGDYGVHPGVQDGHGHAPTGKPSLAGSESPYGLRAPAIQTPEAFRVGLVAGVQGLELLQGAAQGLPGVAQLRQGEAAAPKVIPPDEGKALRQVARVLARGQAQEDPVPGHLAQDPQGGGGGAPRGLDLHLFGTPRHRRHPKDQGAS